LLKKEERAEEMGLPLLVDSNDFQTDYKEKIKLAWECLSSLSPFEKDQIQLLDLTHYEDISVQLKDDQTRLVLGNDQFSTKIKLFQKYRDKLKKFGELEYADLRFPGRLYLKPKANTDQDSIPSAYKETH